MGRARGGHAENKVLPCLAWVDHPIADHRSARLGQHVHPAISSIPATMDQVVFFFSEIAAYVQVVANQPTEDVLC
jgi:hypothetical protein